MLPGLPQSSDRSADIAIVSEPVREVVEIRDDDERTVYVVEPVAVSQTVAPTALAQLTDVAATAPTAPTDGQVLTYKTGTGKWTPATPVAGGGTDPAVEQRLTTLEARPVIDSPDDIGAQPAGDYATTSTLTLGLAGKAASVHTHVVSDVAGLQLALDSKAASAHAHVVSDVAGLQAALDGKAAVGAPASAVAAHEQAADPHPQYLTQAEGSALYAPAGEPASTLAAHVAASDPHPQYLTQAEGDSVYAATSAPGAAVAAHVAATDPHVQYLTTARGDARYPSTAALASAVLAGSIDWRARRFGCKALTLTPDETAFADPTTIRMAQNRLYVYWLPLPQGATVSSVRLPIADLCSGAGAIRFTVYQEDLSVLGSTGDVNAALTGGSANTWRTLPLTAPAVVSGNGVYVTGHSLAPGGNAPGLVFGNTTTSMAWTWNDGLHRTAVRVEGLAAPPSPLDLSTGVDYIDAMIGVA